MNQFRGLNGLISIVKRNLEQHKFSTIITTISIALGVGLVMAVFNIKTQVNNAFVGGDFGYDAVLGARGNKLQLVLNTVYHLENSPGNIPYKLYKDIKRHPFVKLAIPYAVGDNYYGYRIVGTTEDIFTKFEYQKNKKFVFASGKAFEPEKNFRGAVVGSYVAQELKLKPGDTFSPFHGLDFNRTAQHNEIYTVTGVLKATNTPSDKVIWAPIESVFRMEGHVLRGQGKVYTPENNLEIPDEHKEVSAVMLKFRAAHAGILLDGMINKQGKVATLAWPIATVMAGLMNKISWVTIVLKYIAILVVFVSLASILAIIYNSINERKRNFAIFRALGAKKSTVFSMIIAESTTLAFIGSILAYAVYFAIFYFTSMTIRSQTGVVLEIFAFHPVLIYTPISMTVIGAVSGIIPAIKAYSTDVAENLLPRT